MTTYSRTANVADRYKTSKRNVPRMVADGRIPPPKIYNGRFPLWDDQELDENDRRAAARSQLKRSEHNDTA